MLEAIVSGNGGQVNIVKYFGDFFSFKFGLHKKPHFLAYNTSNYSNYKPSRI